VANFTFRQALWLTPAISCSGADALGGHGGDSLVPFPTVAVRQKMNKTEDPDCNEAIEVRNAQVSDAASIWQLVTECEVLDTNSCYAYLLICRDFSATSLVATRGDAVVGFVTAYIPPARPDVLFVWQVGVHATARQRGLAKRLLRELLACDGSRDVQVLEATITPSNTASRRLFETVGQERGGTLQVETGFSARDFGASQHEPEEIIRIRL